MKQELFLGVSLAWCIALFGGCSSADAQKIHWTGLWYDAGGPLARGAFTADLSIEEQEVSGTVTLEGHPLGSFAVTGTQGEEYAGGQTLQTYAQVELKNRDGTAEIGLLQFGSGLSNDSQMYGSLKLAEGNYPIYTAPADVGASVLTSAYKAQVFSLGRIAVQPTTGEVYALARPTEEVTSNSFCAITPDVGTAACSAAFSSSSTMQGYNGLLWFAEGGELVPYADTGTASGDPISIGTDSSSMSSPRSSVIDFAFAGDQVCAITGFVSDSIELFDAETGTGVGTIPGSFSDLYAVAWAGDRYLFLQGMRDGTLDRILAYDVAGNALGQWMAPTNDVNTMAADSTNLFVGTYSGWIFTLPLSQFQQ